MMNDNITISIIIPVYNDEQGLYDNLQIITADPYANLQIIIIDDASDKAIADNVCTLDQRIELYRHHVNKGIAIGVINAIEKTKGDYIFILSANDQLQSGFLAHYLNVIEKYPDAGIYFAKLITYYPETQQLKYFDQGFGDEICCFSANDYAQHYRHYPFHPASHTVFYHKKHLLESLGGFRANHQKHFDSFAIFALIAHHGGVYIPEIISYFTYAEQNKSYTPLDDLKNHGAFYHLFDDFLKDDICVNFIRKSHWLSRFQMQVIYALERSNKFKILCPFGVYLSRLKYIIAKKLKKREQVI